LPVFGRISNFFCGILRNSALDGDKVTNVAYFGRVQVAAENYLLYVSMISPQREIHDCHLGYNGRNIENIDLILSEILPVYLADRLYLSAAVSGDKYCIFSRVVGP